jgi:hypothetical protein
MALAFNIIEKRRVSGIGNNYAGWVDITLDDSYPDGGWPVAASDLGLSVLLGLQVPAISAGGVVLGWNPATSKIVAFEADYDASADDPLIAYATADDDCDGDVIRCFFEGK